MDNLPLEVVAVPVPPEKSRIMDRVDPAPKEFHRLASQTCSFYAVNDLQIWLGATECKRHGMTCT